MTVRSYAECRPKKIQEFARIIFVDDIVKHSRKAEDHAPLKIRPLYDLQPESSQIVRSLDFTVLIHLKSDFYQATTLEVFVPNEKCNNFLFCRL